MVLWCYGVMVLWHGSVLCWRLWSRLVVLDPGDPISSGMGRCCDVVCGSEVMDG